MAARYWRVTGVDGRGAIELSNLRLTLNDTLLPAAATSSVPPAAGSLDALSDGSAGTVCTFTSEQYSAPGFAVEFDCGESVEANGVFVGNEAGGLTSLTLEYLGADGRWQWHSTFNGVPSGAVLLCNDQTLVFKLDSTGPNEARGRYWATLSASSLQLPPGMPGGAYYLPGTNGGYIDYAPAGAIALGPGDFTVHMWLRLDGAQGPYARVLETAAYNSPSNGFVLHISPDGKFQYFISTSGGGTAVVSNAALPVSQPVHIAVERQGNTGRIYVNGVPQTATLAMAGLNVMGMACRIGANTVAGDENFKGHITRLVVARQALYQGATFTPPALSGPAPEPFGVALTVRTLKTLAIRPLVARDMEFGGRASIVGDVGVKGTGGAPDTMVKSRVRLFRQRDGLLARETWSDPVTGAFAFDGLDDSQKFVALAEDGSGVYAPVAADRRVPGVPA